MNRFTTLIITLLVFAGCATIGRNRSEPWTFTAHGPGCIVITWININASAETMTSSKFWPVTEKNSVIPLPMGPRTINLSYIDPYGELHALSDAPIEMYAQDENPAYHLTGTCEALHEILCKRRQFHFVKDCPEK